MPAIVASPWHPATRSRVNMGKSPHPLHSLSFPAPYPRRMSPHTPVIDPGLVDTMAAKATEDECRLFSKSAIRFLNLASTLVLRLRYLESRGEALGPEAKKVAKALRLESEKTGALRIRALCREIESGKVSQPPAELMRKLEDEYQAAEHAFASISKRLGVAVVERNRSRRKSMRGRSF